MVNSITSFASNAYASLPTLKIDTPSNMAKKTTTIALSAVTLIALANLPKASADPFVDCMNNCRRNADNSLALLICQTPCLFAK
ncbi:hypothetical protein [Candidatus Rhabdochlamydia porcellionis]|uniref:Uncharacterized protein n=1 Tax=Candidatus Rhabdochlamydia porcellionis TaxID=225148 RepID=A0ABX8YYC2_9BACT|nr:hypothetical protein [Candidatus Rhabdochlamydia porcellionis]QZA58197.1 hypothetical protein RHAB15C_0000067 [Candidatus Rhabdochlamydia porcellionis]